MNATKTITIYRDSVWAGAGRLDDGHIRDCSAVLGSDQDASDETYDAIEEAIEEAATEVLRTDALYTWEITE